MCPRCQCMRCCNYMAARDCVDYSMHAKLLRGSAVLAPLLCGTETRQHSMTTQSPFCTTAKGLWDWGICLGDWYYKQSLLYSLFFSLLLTYDATCMLLYSLVCMPDGWVHSALRISVFFCNLVSWFHLHIVFDIYWKSPKNLKLRPECLFFWHRLILLLGFSMAAFFCALCASLRQLSFCYWCFDVALVCHLFLTVAICKC